MMRSCINARLLLRQELVPWHWLGTNLQQNFSRSIPLDPDQIQNNDKLNKWWFGEKEVGESTAFVPSGLGLKSARSMRHAHNASKVQGDKSSPRYSDDLPMCGRIRWTLGIGSPALVGPTEQHCLTKLDISETSRPVIRTSRYRRWNE